MTPPTICPVCFFGTVTTVPEAPAELWVVEELVGVVDGVTLEVVIVG